MIWCVDAKGAMDVKCVTFAMKSQCSGPKVSFTRSDNTPNNVLPASHERLSVVEVLLTALLVPKIFYFPVHFFPLDFRGFNSFDEFPSPNVFSTSNHSPLA